jgi:hypothetical protein
MKLTDRPAVTVTAVLTLGAHEVAEARLIVGSVGSVPFAADTTILLGAAPAGCTPLSDGEASAEYLRP